MGSISIGQEHAINATFQTPPRTEPERDRIEAAFGACVFSQHPGYSGSSIEAHLSGAFLCGPQLGPL